MNCWSWLAYVLPSGLGILRSVMLYWNFRLAKNALGKWNTVGFSYPFPLTGCLSLCPFWPRLGISTEEMAVLSPENLLLNLLVSTQWPGGRIMSSPCKFSEQQQLRLSTLMCRQAFICHNLWISNLNIYNTARTWSHKDAYKWLMKYVPKFGASLKSKTAMWRINL